MRWPGSLRVQLTLWYSVLLAVPLITFAVASYVTVARTLRSRTDRFLSDALTTFSRELVAERRIAPGLPAAVRKTLEEVRFRDLRIAVLDSAGAVLAHTTIPEEREASPGPDWSVLRREMGELTGYGAGNHSRTIASGRASFRVTAFPIQLDGEPMWVMGAAPLGDLESVLHGLQRLFGIGIPLLIAGAAAGGSLLARRSLAPVAAMAARATEITASRLDERLPVSGSKELSDLAVVINELLDRLERAFAQQRRFVADASHELRTPTAIVRSEADVTLRQAHRDEAQYRESMTVIRDAARRLSRIVDDLFLLARSDAGQLTMQSEALYLDDVVQEAVRSMASVAEQKQVRIRIEGLSEAPIHGDADLLGRLLLNLLDNAVRYSPAGEAVDVAMERRNGECSVRVTDRGPGVPEEVRPRVFEPFFRVDSARTRENSPGSSGAGLGLAIARRIAEMHTGRLDLAESRPGLTAFRLVLPLQPLST